MRFLKNQKLNTIIGLLVVTNLVAAGYAFYFKNQNLQYENPYPYIDISRNFIPQEHFITTLQPLRDELNQLVAKEAEGGSTVSVYIEYLNTGANVSINTQIGIWPA